MYNESIKQMFIKSKKDNNTFIDTILLSCFEKTSIFEEMFQKDVSEFGMKEIIDMYKILNMDSFDVLAVFNSNLFQYTQFCLERGLIYSNRNVYQEITSDILIQCLNKSLINRQIISREDILSYVARLKNYRDKFIMLSLFEFGTGKKNYEDISHAKIKDIDKEKKKIKLYSGRIVNISPELISIAEGSVEQEYYRSDMLETLLIDDGTIIKKKNNCININDEFGSGRSIYLTIKKSLDDWGISEYINSNKIVISGEIHYVKSEAKRLGLSPSEYLKKFKYKVSNQFGKKIVMKTFLLKYSDYL